MASLTQMDMSLSKLWEIVKDREARRAAVHGVQQQYSNRYTLVYIYKIDNNKDLHFSHFQGLWYTSHLALLVETKIILHLCQPLLGLYKISSKSTFFVHKSQRAADRKTFEGLGKDPDHIHKRVSCESPSR